MKKTVFLVVIILAVYKIKAQVYKAPSIQWSKVMGGSMQDLARQIKQTLDGGYVIVGKTQSNDGDVVGFHVSNSGSYSPDFWVVKLDSSGNCLWKKSLGGDMYDAAYSIDNTKDSGFIITGFTASNNGDVSGCHSCSIGPLLWNGDFWVVKLDKNGNIDWQKCLGGSKSDEANSVIQTKDGNYIVAGGTESINGDVTNNKGGGDCWIIKLDTLGKIIWQKTYGGSMGEEINSIVQTKDGGYIAIADTYSNDSDVTFNHGKYDTWIIKLDSIGKIVWQKSYGGSDWDYSKCIQPTSDGGYIFLSTTYSTDGDLTGNSNTGTWIVKLDSIGKIGWQKVLDTSNTGYFTAYSIQETKDHRYILCGDNLSNSGNTNGNHGNTDFGVIMLDNTGNQIWQKCYGGSNYDEKGYLSITKDGSFIMGGYSSSKDGDVGFNHSTTNSFQDFWIVKLAPDTLVLPVNILGFYATRKESYINLQWTTLTETNVLNFNIQRSDDGKIFSTIDKKVANNKASNYSYNDTNTILKDKLYYRLEIIDNDGSKSYSEIKSVMKFSSSPTILIYPNPAKDFVTVEGVGIKQITISNNIGGIMETRKVRNQFTTFDISNYVKGIYFIQITCNNNTTTRKVIIE